jgi:mannose-6-phosphate isomerase-like protein (cupin superfamily)
MHQYHILRHIADLYEAGTIACDGMLDDAARELRILSATAPAWDKSSRLPVTRELPYAIDAALGTPLAGIATDFTEIEPLLRWRQNPNYTTATIGEVFLERYGYVELVGRDCPWQSENIAVGFLLLGRGAHYPVHHHPAREVYHVVAGASEWWRSERDWTAEPPGAAIYHAPNVRHATRVLEVPLLALYCWQGDTGIAAQLS